MNESEGTRRGMERGYARSRLLRVEEINLRIVRLLLEDVWGTGAFHLLPGIVDPTYVSHIPLGDHYGPEGVRIEVQSYRSVLPDMAITINELRAQGNRVYRQFTVAGTYAQRTVVELVPMRLITLEGRGLDCLSDGMLIESWVEIDPLPS